VCFARASLREDRVVTHVGCLRRRDAAVREPGDTNTDRRLQRLSLTGVLSWNCDQQDEGFFLVGDQKQRRKASEPGGDVGVDLVAD
jgi:hypothetical protein